MHHRKAALASKSLDFVQGGWMHIHLWFSRTVPERHRHRSARLKQ
jgi:hypothetical protein